MRMPSLHTIPSLYAVCAVLLAPAAATAAPLTSEPDPSAIIGGAPSASCDWPSTVRLEGGCTATLIHPEIVVYAAHCGEDKPAAWFGEDLTDGVPPPGSGFSVATEYCVTNPEWNDGLSILGPRRAYDYAFCKLARPVTEVPIVPPAFGCEVDSLVPGTPVTLVGFGYTEDFVLNVKHAVETELHGFDDWGAAVIGGDGRTPCAGDSGGPAFAQMPDGTWRAFGIVSGYNIPGPCADNQFHFATIHDAIPFIETRSGIDVTACHSGADGTWNPSPGCGGSPMNPGDGSGSTWTNGCGGGEVAGPNETCGPAFDPAEDLEGPTGTITSPEDRARFDTEGGSDTVAITVAAELADLPSGVARAVLVVEGVEVGGSLRLGTPFTWDLAMPPGIWDISVRATDWAGNDASVPAVVIGIDEDPPVAEPSTTSGAETSGDDTASDDTSGGVEATTTSGVQTTSGTDSASAGAGVDGMGCECASDRRTTPPALALVLALGLGLRRRPRRYLW